LSSANWGGQGLHPRGNFEGFVRAGLAEKWLEVHGIEHWTHFYTDYGVRLQKRFFGHFLKGEEHRMDAAAARRASGAPSGERFVERPEREWAARPHALDEALPEPGRGEPRHGAARRRRERELRGLRRRGHVADAAARRRDGDHRAPRGQALGRLRDHGRRPLPGDPRVHTGSEGGPPSRGPSIPTRRSRRAGSAPRTGSSTPS